MNCIIDRGNTKTKIYFFKGDNLIESFQTLNTKEEELVNFLSIHKFNRGILSSSSDYPNFLNLENFILLTKEISIPIVLNYNTPETLGTDRIALAVGAHFLYPNQNCLVISAGTCITIDFIDHEGIYQGGIITPGKRMRMQAMNSFTKNLPLLPESKQTDFPLLGKTTKESMESGVYNGVVAEIEQTIERFKDDYKDLTVIITGGDHILFEFHLKNKIFAQQNLQAIGLNRILLHNAR